MTSEKGKRNLSIIKDSTSIGDEKIIYPESDGQPIADNSVQFSWITTIKGNMDILFAQEVYIARDMFWYPVPRNN